MNTQINNSIYVLILQYISRFLAVLFVLSYHELIKGLISTKFGDDVPKKNKKLTFNPFKNIDVFGLIVGTVYGFGWGNPIKTSNVNYKNKKKDTIITYSFPTLINLLLGLCFYFLSKTFYSIFIEDIKNTILIFSVYSIIYFFLTQLSFVNFATGLFNLIPIFPCDGFSILKTIKPNIMINYYKYEKILQLVLLMLIFLGIIPMAINFITYNILR